MRVESDEASIEGDVEILPCPPCPPHPPHPPHPFLP